MKTEKKWSRGHFKVFLERYKFKYYTNITSNGEHLSFKPCEKHWFFKTSSTVDWSDKGWVYLWTEEDTSKKKPQVKIVYVGKTGKTMRDRCKTHSGGGSSPGKDHSDRICKGSKGKKSYCVYAKKSESADPRTVFGEQDISMCHVEEEAFIQMLKGLKFELWNRPQ